MVLVHVVDHIRWKRFKDQDHYEIPSWDFIHDDTWSRRNGKLVYEKIHVVKQEYPSQKVSFRKNHKHKAVKRK